MSELIPKEDTDYKVLYEHVIQINNVQGTKIRKLRGLLIEWMNTPFFEDKKDWQEWVDEFMPRVRAEVEKKTIDAN